jgi:hypothetical protein
VPQVSVHSPTLYSLYINDAPQIPGVQLAHSADVTCIRGVFKFRRQTSRACRWV